MLWRAGKMGRKKEGATRLTELFLLAASGPCRACRELPMELIDGIRDCIDAGMSAEAVLGALKLIEGMHRAASAFDPVELMVRTESICRVIEGDVSRHRRMQEVRAWVRERLGKLEK